MCLSPLWGRCVYGGFVPWNQGFGNMWCLPGLCRKCIRHAMTAGALGRPSATSTCTPERIAAMDTVMQEIEVHVEKGMQHGKKFMVVGFITTVTGNKNRSLCFAFLNICTQGSLHKPKPYLEGTIARTILSLVLADHTMFYTTILS